MDGKKSKGDVMFVGVFLYWRWLSRDLVSVMSRIFGCFFFLPGLFRKTNSQMVALFDKMADG
jgi:hypothetical protein